MMNKINFNEYIGKNINRLTICSFEHRGYTPYFNCSCKCGTEKSINAYSIIYGKTTSCGCIQRERVSKHQKSNTRLYRIWEHIKDRCLNPNNEAYKNYGGRGVYICKEWENNFLGFYNWSIKNGYKENLTIDRIDVNGNYCPENCRWITQKEQQQNRRNNKKIVTESGEMCLSEFSRKTGIKFNKVCRWYDRGMNANEIIGIGPSTYRGKKIYCETNGKTYSNASEFLKDVGLKKSGWIYDFLNGKSKSDNFHGYKIKRIFKKDKK